MKNQTAILAAVAAITTTAGLTAVDVSDFEGPIDILLHHAAATGSSTPTVAAKLQHSVDGSTNWADVTDGAFTAITTTAGLQRKEINVDGLRKFVRLHNTVSGTSPSAVLGCVVVGSKKYGNA